MISQKQDIPQMSYTDAKKERLRLIAAIKEANDDELKDLRKESNKLIGAAGFTSDDKKKFTTHTKENMIKFLESEPFIKRMRSTLKNANKETVESTTSATTSTF